jgi:DNA-binding GntR family transcriptional regulator
MKAEGTIGAERTAGMTMAAEARKPPSMALQVADRIRNAIILAEFDLGEALS